jgi:hypothetical protein
MRPMSALRLEAAAQRWCLVADRLSGRLLNASPSLNHPKRRQTGKLLSRQQKYLLDRHWMAAALRRDTALGLLQRRCGGADTVSRQPLQETPCSSELPLPPPCVCGC